MYKKKLLAGILSAAMLLSGLSVSALADTTDEWGDNTVKVGGNYYTTMTAALNAVYMSNPTDTVTIDCKPGADVGTMTHGHVADSIIINGNGAFVSKGEHDLEVDTYMFNRETGKQDINNGVYLDKDIKITVNDLDQIAIWGERKTNHKIDIEFNNCKDMNRVYLTGVAGTTNITLNNCSFNSENGSNQNTSIYSNAKGEINLNKIDFSNIAIAVNMNNKSKGLQTINVNGCTFTNCSTATLAAATNSSGYAAPIRVLTGVDGSKTVLNVKDCTITGENCGNGDILIGEGRPGKESYSGVDATIENTAANVQIQSIVNNEKVVENVTAAADSTTHTGNMPKAQYSAVNKIVVDAVEDEKGHSATGIKSIVTVGENSVSKYIWTYGDMSAVYDDSAAISSFAPRSTVLFGLVVPQALETVEGIEFSVE